MSNVAQEAAAGVLGDVFEEQEQANTPDFMDEIREYAEDAPAPAEQPAEPVEAEETAPSGFVLDPELPAEIAALLAEAMPADDDEEDEEDEEIVVVGESDEYEDEEVKRLRVQLAKQVKRNEHLEGQRVKQSQKAWRAEATQFFPLSSPETITATTRKEFIRQAQAQHVALKPKFELALAEKEAELRAESRGKWGAPVTGPGFVPPEATEATAKIREIRDSSSNLQQNLKKRIEAGILRF